MSSASKQQKTQLDPYFITGDYIMPNFSETEKGAISPLRLPLITSLEICRILSSLAMEIPEALSHLNLSDICSCYHLLFSRKWCALVIIKTSSFDVSGTGCTVYEYIAQDVQYQEV
ncbi:hypothetical protein EMCRGX_G004096 [Ephydatia muelleri]